MFFIASFTDALSLLQYQRHAQAQNLWIRGIVEVNRVENGLRHFEYSSGISSIFEFNVKFSIFLRSAGFLNLLRAFRFSVTFFFLQIQC